MLYELLITTVSERADLLAEAIVSHLDQADVPPTRILVHEDVRPGSDPNAVAKVLTDNFRGIEIWHQVTSPARGLGEAMRWLFSQAETPYVLYTQEDYAAARPLPIAQTLQIMEKYGLNQVRFNQRNTLPCKHGDKGRNPNAWRKVEVEMGGQVFCIGDHYYTQTALWLVAPALEGMNAVLKSESTLDSAQFVSGFNHWMNEHHGDGKRAWNDQMMRHEQKGLRTYIYGGIGERSFLKSLDMDGSRTTGRPR